MGFIGLNALTGGVAASPFKTVLNLKLDSVHWQEITYNAAEEATSSFQHKNISSSGTISVEVPPGLSHAQVESFTTGFGLDKSKEVSQRAIKYYFRKKGKFEIDQLDLGGLQLNDNARRLLEERKYDQFRNKYGDYFVTGQQKLFSFKVVMECK